MKDASGRRTHILPLLTIAYALSMLDRTIISLMIVPLQRDLGLSDTDFALLSGFAFSIMFTCLGIPMGWLSDRVQRSALRCGA